MIAERPSFATPAPGDTTVQGAEPTPIRRRPRPSATRSASLSRANRVRQVRLGNVNGLRHGVFAVVQAAPDVATEIALTLVSHPGLELADRRLVELLAATRVSRQRALLAMATEGLTPTLTGYDARLSMLEERLERALHDRELERVSARNAGSPDPLERYRAGGGS